MQSKTFNYKYKPLVDVSIAKALKSIFKNYLFILFSFANMLIPLYATIISSLIGPHGSLNVTIVGLATSFISIFNQFLFLIALTINFVLHRDMMFDRKDKIIDKQTISSIMFFYSLFATILFVATSLLYIRFSILYQGFSESFMWAVQLIVLIAPTFIVNGFIYLNVIYKLEICKWKSVLCYVIFFILHLCLIPLFYLAIPWGNNVQLCGLGIGFLSSSILGLLGVIIFNYEKGWKNNFKINWHDLKTFIVKTGNFVWDFLIAIIMKGFLVMFIGVSLNLASKPTFPSLMVAKILWYNSLFFCGFFGDGLFYAIEYTKMQMIAKYQMYKSSSKYLLVLGTITFIATLLICTIFNFAAMELSDLYAKNETQPIEGMFPDGQQIKNYLFCTTNSVLSPLTGNYTKTFAFVYLTIYHCFINSFKIMSIKDTQINQPFSWKKMLFKFIALVVIMGWIACFAVGFNDGKKFGSFLDAFNGLDSFSFALLTVGAAMFVPCVPKIIVNCVRER